MMCLIFMQVVEFKGTLFIFYLYVVTKNYQRG